MALPLSPIPLRRVEPGAPVSAAQWNAIVAELERMRRQHASLTTQLAAIAALTRVPGGVFVPAVITVITPLDADERGYFPDGGTDPDTLTGSTAPVRYGVQAVGRQGIGLEDALPVYGRPVRNNEARIYAASVGMVCFIVRSTTHDPDGAPRLRGELMLLPGSEVLAYRPCESFVPISGT